MARDKKKTLDIQFPAWREWMQICTRPFTEEFLRLNPSATEIDAIAAINAASWVLAGELTQERQATAIRLWQERTAA
jgi:hypothetical protein